MLKYFLIQIMEFVVYMIQGHDSMLYSYWQLFSKFDTMVLYFMHQMIHASLQNRGCGSTVYFQQNAFHRELGGRF